VQGVDRVTSTSVAVQTPFGRPVGWAEAALVTDIGDSHELNDDRCLVLTSSDLGLSAGASNDFMLCLLADGATGSTFDARAVVQHSGVWQRHAGWRASQLAQSAFVECFLSSTAVDMLDRLKEGLRAADRALTDSAEGTLSTTLVALYLAADGTAYAASIGDSTLLVLPPRRKTPGERRLKKLGHEDSTSVGSGDTTLSTIDESECIEQWWPHKEDGGSTTRVAPGTYMVLMSDGISDNLPAELIDQLVHRHPLDRATVGLPSLTRERRLETQKRSGGSTQQLGLDNMSAIVVRFDGLRRAGALAPNAHLDDTSLVTVVGTHGGPTPDAGGQFGIACLTGRDTSVVGACVRHVIESEHPAEDGDRLAEAFSKATSGTQNRDHARLAMLAVDEHGKRHSFSSGGVSIGPGTNVPVSIVERTIAAARESSIQRLIRRPSLWGPAIAALAIFVLVSTAFATGTVRPAPPPAPTPRPGEPRPTADTRPFLSIGGFVLRPRGQPTPVGVALEPGSVADPQSGGISEDSSQSVAPGEAAVQPTPDNEPAQPAPTCTNLFGIGCPPPAPPLRPMQPAPGPLNGPVPVPSPAPLPAGSIGDFEVATSAPPRGSRLESALQGASVADENFAREVAPAGR